jgi:benzoylformate decarboxylase
LPTMSGSQALMELLKQEGVKILFGNPGTTEVPLLDALAFDDELRYVLGLQEAAVVAMADGYAQPRASLRLSICTLRPVPGLRAARGWFRP